MNKSIFLGFLLATLTGCIANAPVAEQAATQVATADTPVWIAQVPQRLGYLYGIGSAEVYGSLSAAVTRAQEQARIDLVSRIQVTISSESSVSSQMATRNGELVDLHDSVMQQINSHVAEVTLPGIQVIETWVTPDERTVWALAELNKLAAEDQLLQQLSEIDQRILARPFPATGDRLSRVRVVTPDLTDLAERQEVVAQLDFLGASHQIDAQRQQQIAQREEQISSLLASLGFHLNATNAAASQMLPTMASALTSMGFQLQSHNPDLVLNLQLNETSVKRGSLFHSVVQAQAQVATADGRVLYSLDEQGRASSGDAQVARIRSAEAMAEMLSRKLVEGLLEHL